MLEKRLTLQAGVIAPRRQSPGTDDHLLTCQQALPGILCGHEKTGTTASLSPLLNMRGATQVHHKHAGLVFKADLSHVRMSVR
jgi:hypothetical protein